MRIITQYMYNSCIITTHRYILDPDESRDDLYYLMSNGSIYAPNHDPMLLQPGHDYCMETIPELGLRPLVCFPKGMMVPPIINIKTNCINNSIIINFHKI